MNSRARWDPQSNTILQLMMQVCSPCQNDCYGCCNSYIRTQQPHFQLSLTGLENFINCCLESHYQIDQLWLNGPGDPLLWKNLSPGLEMIRQSGIVRKIQIASNGLAIDKISDQDWDNLDVLRITCYPHQNDRMSALQRVQEYHKKLLLMPREKFYTRERGSSQLPCNCSCEGPMLLGDTIYFYCGPMVTEAIALAKEAGVMEDPVISVPVKSGFMDLYNEDYRGNLVYCPYCWANTSLTKKWIPHKGRR